MTTTSLARFALLAGLGSLAVLALLAYGGQATRPVDGDPTKAWTAYCHLDAAYLTLPASDRDAQQGVCPVADGPFGHAMTTVGRPVLDFAFAAL